jgi:hypothetical protein
LRDLAVVQHLANLTFVDGVDHGVPGNAVKQISVTTESFSNVMTYNQNPDLGVRSVRWELYHPIELASDDVVLVAVVRHLSVTCGGHISAKVVPCHVKFIGWDQPIVVVIEIVRPMRGHDGSPQSEASFASPKKKYSFMM